MFCFDGHGETFVNLDKANQPPRKFGMVNVWPADEYAESDGLVHSISLFHVFIFAILFRASHGRKDELEKERK